MQSIVLAGGAGTRLRPVVADLPKPLAPIGGRPFLAYLLSFLERQGVSEAILAVGYRSGQIEQAFGPRYGNLRLRYSVEREPLGTGGALRQALRLIDRFPALALNGDTYLELDLESMRHAHERASARLTVVVRRMAEIGRYGRVVTEGDRIVGFAAASGEGSGIINCGTYLFAENVLAAPDLPERFSFEKEFLEPRVAALRPLAFETQGYFIDIGVPEDYRRAERELAGREAVRPCDAR
jgi:D-glycero-alpha-D-manno-heptose 1-phosphate guanylyltransferase